MSEDVSRREAHKSATRAAIEHAAQRLVAEQGFEATTVGQIADAAGVTERTFYRYFDGKAGLIADEARVWMERVATAIRERPSSEPAMVAMQEGMLAVVGEIRGRPDTAPVWLFAETPQQYEIMQRSTPRPLIRFEDALAQALLARTGDSTEGRREAELIARVSVAVLRSAGIYRRRLMARGDERAADLEPLLREAFDSLAQLTRPLG
jgi:AcrR family transcriptional regulator